MFIDRALPFSSKAEGRPHIPIARHARPNLMLAVFLLTTSTLFAQSQGNKVPYMTFDPPHSTDTEPAGINQSVSWVELLPSRERRALARAGANF